LFSRLKQPFHGCLARHVNGCRVSTAAQHCLFVDGLRFDNFLTHFGVHTSADISGIETFDSIAFVARVADLRRSTILSVPHLIGKVGASGEDFVACERSHAATMLVMLLLFDCICHQLAHLGFEGALPGPGFDFGFLQRAHTLTNLIQCRCCLISFQLARLLAG